MYLRNEAIASKYKKKQKTKTPLLGFISVGLEIFNTYYIRSFYISYHKK